MDEDTDGEFRTLLDMIRGSAIACVIVPKRAAEIDLRFAAELGVIVFLGKPLVVAVRAGAQVSAKLAACADRIVEISGDEAADGRALQAALREVAIGAGPHGGLGSGGFSAEGRRT